MKESNTQEPALVAQGIPLFLTVIIFLILTFFIFLEILFLNTFTILDIAIRINWQDILIGLTIYLKTSVDFAIFIGNLMARYPGWRNRIAIESGTALGNALGTMIILGIWNIFRNIEWLLALMVIVASLVLFRLAEEGLEHALTRAKTHPGLFATVTIILSRFLKAVNKIINPLVKYLIPQVAMKGAAVVGFWGLFGLSFSIPFILGLDDFAGYVPVFNIVNVLGFSVGVLAGHMILNIFLFISPRRTITLVKNPVISLLGSIAFIGLALFGLYEVAEMIFHH